MLINQYWKYWVSSAEAELSALTEAAKEGIYTSLLLETFLQGLPSGEVGSYPIYLESDSEAALSIARMTGLLRRVCHLELRHRYLQELVRNERLILSHLSGEMNPADGLMKSPEHASMFNNMVNACGLERIPATLTYLSYLKTCLPKLRSLRKRLRKPMRWPRT